MGRAGGVAAAGLVSTAGFSASGLGSGNGLAFADFNHGAVQPYFTHDNIARKQGAQLQLGHAAFDGDDHALPIAGAAPVRLSKIDAGGKKEIPGGLSNVKGCPVALAVASAICRTTKPASTLLSRTAAATARTVAPPRIHKNTRFIETPQVFAALAAA